MSIDKERPVRLSDLTPEQLAIVDERGRRAAQKFNREVLAVVLIVGGFIAYALVTIRVPLP